MMKLLLLLTFAISVSCAQFVCLDSWLSDGNFYDVDLCTQTCVQFNSNQKVENVAELSYNCCHPVCQAEVRYHTGKRIAIIAAASLILLIVVFCCLYGCFGPSIKQYYVLKKQYQSRKPVHIGMAPQQYNKYAQQFVKLFADQSSMKWVITFLVENNQISEQLNQVQMKYIKTYHYELKLAGQDVKGLWASRGYFTNTEKGPMIWGLKNYQNAQNTKIYFQKYSENIYELIRNQQGNYEGVWYQRSNPQKKHRCTVIRQEKKIREISGQQKTQHIYLPNVL